jgi:hypothetical protein
LLKHCRLQATTVAVAESRTDGLIYQVGRKRVPIPGKLQFSFATRPCPTSLAAFGPPKPKRAAAKQSIGDAKLPPVLDQCLHLLFHALLISPRGSNTAICHPNLAGPDLGLAVRSPSRTGAPALIRCGKVCSWQRDPLITTANLEREGHPPSHGSTGDLLDSAHLAGSLRPFAISFQPGSSLGQRRCFSAPQVP